MTRFRVAFVVLAAVWAVLVLVAPFATAWPGSASASSFAARALTVTVYGIGRLICHQRAERSFHLAGAQLPVCARCTGIYAGAALAAVVAWWLSRVPPPRHRNFGVATRGVAQRVLLIAIAPTLATILFEWTTGEMPGPWTRAMSGVPLGVAVAWIVCGTAAAEPKVM